MGDVIQPAGPSSADHAGLRSVLADMGPVVVAFSGGVDSGLLAWVAADALGTDAAPAVTAVSPSLAARERSEAARLAEAWGLAFSEVATTEHRDPAYRANDGDRCRWCKEALMDAVGPLARERGATVVLGVNADDGGDHRPGQAAAARRGARFPLAEAGLTKADVRSLARALGLEIADKPAAPCLASRVPYGTEVSVALLGRIERAEAALAGLGFAELRVRHADDVARLEVPVADMERVLARRAEVVEAVRAAGYRRVTLDLEGLRSGNLNELAGIVGPAAST